MLFFKIIVWVVIVALLESIALNGSIMKISTTKGLSDIAAWRVCSIGKSKMRSEKTDYFHSDVNLILNIKAKSQRNHESPISTASLKWNYEEYLKTNFKMLLCLSLPLHSL